MNRTRAFSLAAGFLFVSLLSCRSRFSEKNTGNADVNQFGLGKGVGSRPADFGQDIPAKIDKAKYCKQAETSEEGLDAVARKAGPNYMIVRSDYAPHCLNYKNTAEGFPPNLQGIWWMNGNPIPEVLITMADSPWDNTEKFVSLKPNEPGNWSWVANDKLGANLFGGPKTDATVRIYFDVDKLSEPQRMTSTEIAKDGALKTVKDWQWLYTLLDPILVNKKHTEGFRPKGARDVVEYETTPGSDGLIRRTKFLSVLETDYILTRIVDGDGNILKENYLRYLSYMSGNKGTETGPGGKDDIAYYSGIQVNPLKFVDGKAVRD